MPELAVVGLQLSNGIMQCGSILPRGLQDGLAVRHELCHGAMALAAACLSSPWSGVWAKHLLILRCRMIPKATHPRRGVKAA